MSNSWNDFPRSRKRLDEAIKSKDADNTTPFRLKYLKDIVWDLEHIPSAPTSVPTLNSTEVAFGDINNEMTSSPDLKFNNTELGVQSVVNVATSPDYVSGEVITINFANGTTNDFAFGTDIYYSSAGNTGGSQAAGVHVVTDFATNSTTGVYTGIDVSPTNTAAGATIDVFEGMSVDGFSNNATINTYYAYYSGGVSAGAGTINNQYGLYLENMDQGITNSYALFTNAGKVHLGGILPFANNAAALAGGLVVGDTYYTDVAGDGILKIVI